MKILIADDEEGTRLLLKHLLPKWGFEVVEATNGDEAVRLLHEDSSLRMAILDWQMPDRDGMEVAHYIRHTMRITPFYIIMLTSRSGRLNTIEGMQSGVDDYVTKPLDKEMLQARLEAGIRSVEQQTYLVRRINELQDRLSGLEELEKHLPICGQCKRVKADNGKDWFPVQALAGELLKPANAELLCPVCAVDDPQTRPVA